MDAKSHELFSNTLLESLGYPNLIDSWSISPDIDMKYFHRYYRHRISKIPVLYTEFLNKECKF